MSGDSTPDLADKIQGDLKHLRADMEEALSGKARDRESQKASIWGRIDTLEDNVKDLKEAAQKAEQQGKDDAARVEKYRAGALIALAGSVIGWIVTRVLGGG